MEGVWCFHFPDSETHCVKLTNIAIYETRLLPLCSMVFIAVERELTQKPKSIYHVKSITFHFFRLKITSYLQNKKLRLSLFVLISSIHCKDGRCVRNDGWWAWIEKPSVWYALHL
jgi:hypothetical protein